MKVGLFVAWPESAERSPPGKEHSSSCRQEETTMRARPHHPIDIITQHGAGQPFEPCEYGHAVHTVAAEAIANPEVRLEFGVGADDICAPCRHLGACPSKVQGGLAERVGV